MKVNDRVLYRVTGSSTVKEATVKEISPSGKYVAMFPDGWLVQADVTVVEQLPTEEVAKPQAAATEAPAGATGENPPA